MSNNDEQTELLCQKIKELGSKDEKTPAANLSISETLTTDNQLRLMQYLLVGGGLSYILTRLLASVGREGKETRRDENSGQ